MNTIFKKMMLGFVILITTIAVSIGTISYVIAKNQLTSEYERALTSKAMDNALIIEERMHNKIKELASLANQPDIQSMIWQQQLPLIKAEATRLNYDEIAIVDPKGEAHYSDGEILDLSDRSYIKLALKGQATMSDIIISRKTNLPALMIAVPIEKGQSLQGVLLARIDGYYLSDIVEDIRFGSTGFTYILNEEGKILAHQDREIVLQETNYITLADENSIYSQKAQLMKEMIDHQSGFVFTQDEDGKKIISYTPIQGTNWIIVTGAFESEITSGLSGLLRSIIILTLVAIFIGAAVAYLVSRLLANGIKQVEQYGQQLALGNFTVVVDSKLLLRKDELGALARSFEEMRNELKQMISSIRQTSDQVVSSSTDMHSSSSQVAEATEHITSNMEDIASLAQASAKASDETMAAMNINNNGLHQIASSASQIFEAATSSNILAEEGNITITDAMQQMNEIHHSVSQSAQYMNELAKQTEEVKMVVDAISEIAGQTNLLALNASIEAARAGTEGAGFAVIAQQVRKLADQSQRSAKATITLMERIAEGTQKAMTAMVKGQHDVDSGVSAIQQAEDAFVQIKQSMEMMTAKLQHITEASQQLTTSSDTVTTQMEQMNKLSQEAALSAESILAATEEQMASLQEVASTSNHVRHIAMQMNDQMKNFNIDS